MKKILVFNNYFLHPRFWGIWIGIGILYILVLLPYPMIYYIGIKIGSIAKYFLVRRMYIMRKNLNLCFPHLSLLEQQTLFHKNCESIGMGILETGMAWFWSEHRIRHWCKIHGLSNLSKLYNKQVGTLLIGTHFFTLELSARILGIINPGIGVYRPHNNPLLEWLQTKGRLKSNKNMLNRSNIRSIIKALKDGEIVWYAPDHDYGYKNSIFVPFFAVSNVATTIGTYILIKTANPAVIPFILKRLPNASGYELTILKDQKNEIPINTKFNAIRHINKIIEQLILFAPDQYMWLHRRFKTRPPGEPSVY